MHFRLPMSLFFVAILLLLTARQDFACAQRAQAEKQLSAQNQIGSPAVEHDQALNEDQALYLKYAEGRWGAFLNRVIYAQLPEATRTEVEAYWLRKLQAPGITLPPPEGDGFEGYPPAYHERFEAINLLAALKSKSAVDSLVAIATANIGKDNRDRWMAVRALGLIGDRSVVPKLIPLIYYPNSNTRQWSQITLVRLTGKNYGYDHQAWGKWWNSSGATSHFDERMVEWNLDTITDAEERRELRDPTVQKADDQDLLRILRGIFGNPRF